MINLFINIINEYLSIVLKRNIGSIHLSHCVYLIMDADYSGKYLIIIQSFTPS